MPAPPNSPRGPARGPNTAEQRNFVGSVIDDRYEVQSQLGVGGMGIVFKARHTRLNKPVALKLLRKAEDETAKKRFMQEAQSASQIKHSNIVDITDFGTLPDGYLYLVMEFIEGETLHHAMAQGRMDPLRACRIAAQIARGLLAVHDHGIIHRDLKPENVFLVEREGQKDQVKIVDFGIAKAAGPAAQRLTADGMVVGTAEYMSPEQATGRNVDHRTDQYALGCILYEMLAGVLPFQAKNAAAMLHKQVYESVLPPSQRNPERQIPASLEALVMRTLEKDAGKRFPTMRDMEQALLREAEALSRHETLPVPAARAPLPWTRFALIGAAVGVVLVLVVVLARLLHSEPPPPAQVPPPVVAKPAAPPPAPPPAVVPPVHPPTETPSEHRLPSGKNRHHRKGH